MMRWAANMKRNTITKIAACAVCCAAVSVTCAMRAESVAGGIRVAEGGTKWRMFDRRVGMFVHWGVYSVGGVHEQEWMRAGMTKE